VPKAKTRNTDRAEDLLFWIMLFPVLAVEDCGKRWAVVIGLILCVPWLCTIGLIGVAGMFVLMIWDIISKIATGDASA